MTKEIRHLLTTWRFLLLLGMLAGVVTGTSSCENDEPDLEVGYYLGIQSQVRLNLSENDESQGTSAQPYADMLSTTIVKMRVALRNAYPTPNTHGNDSRVIAALDDIYMDYKSMYGASEKNTVCVVKLYRTRMEDDVVRKSKTLKTYHFGAIPPGTEETGS